jgi:hypothetical protein
MGGAICPQLKNAIATTERFMVQHRGKVAKRLAVRLAERQRDMFANERDVYDKPFAPLAESTLQRKRYSPGGPLILSRTFELWNSSYVLFTGGRAVWHIGESGQYAQLGDTGRGNRPRRRLWPEGVVPKTWTQDMKASADEEARSTKL